MGRLNPIDSDVLFEPFEFWISGAKKSSLSLGKRRGKAVSEGNTPPRFELPRLLRKCFIRRNNLEWELFQLLFGQLPTSEAASHSLDSISDFRPIDSGNQMPCSGVRGGFQQDPYRLPTGFFEKEGENRITIKNDGRA